MSSLTCLLKAEIKLQIEKSRKNCFNHNGNDEEDLDLRKQKKLREMNVMEMRKNKTCEPEGLKLEQINKKFKCFDCA